MRRIIQILIFSNIIILTSCQVISPYFKQSEINTRQGKVKIIDSLGLNKEAENYTLTSKPFKDPNVPEIIRQEYSFQVDF